MVDGRVLEFIAASVAERGYAISIRELCIEMGWNVRIGKRPVWGTRDAVTGSARTITVRVGSLRLHLEVWTEAAEDETKAYGEWYVRTHKEPR